MAPTEVEGKSREASCENNQNRDHHDSHTMNVQLVS